VPLYLPLSLVQFLFHKLLQLLFMQVESLYRGSWDGSERALGDLS